jgi:peptidoglycan/LPS O-acetylase OafA/YrhL
VNPGQIAVLQAIAATSAWVAGLIFLRFWRDSGDRLFAFFGTAFWLLASSWLLLGFTNPTEEARPYIYGLRLVAFLLIIGGMIDKNRR